ncbi:hypothetical protein TRVL_07656 [Trypanosoma vivax]|nr:hypothetical protein TRVL_07656 [Trypanosoma vivax]
MLCFAVTPNGLAYSSNAAMAATVSSHSTCRAAHTQLELAQAPNTTPQFDLQQHSTSLLPVLPWQPGKNFMPPLKRVKDTLEMLIINHPVTPELRINVRGLFSRFKGMKDLPLNGARKPPIDVHDSSYFSCPHFYSFGCFAGTRNSQAPLSVAEQFTDNSADLHRSVERQVEVTSHSTDAGTVSQNGTT